MAHVFPSSSGAQWATTIPVTGGLAPQMPNAGGLSLNPWTISIPGSNPSPQYKPTVSFSYDARFIPGPHGDEVVYKIGLLGIEYRYGDGEADPSKLSVRSQLLGSMQDTMAPEMGPEGRDQDDSGHSPHQRGALGIDLSDIPVALQWIAESEDGTLLKAKAQSILLYKSDAQRLVKRLMSALGKLEDKEL